MKEHMKVLEKELTDIAYVYESKQLAIRNLNNTQRDLQLMEAEEKKEAELYFRTEQETIEIDEQNRRIVQDLAQMDMLLLEEDRIAAINEQVVAHLKYEIGHQEMSVEETELVKLEIRNTKERILECKREHERNIVMLETQCSQCLEHFCQR